MGTTLAACQHDTNDTKTTKIQGNATKGTNKKVNDRGKTKKMKEGFTKRKINTRNNIVGSKITHVRRKSYTSPFLMLPGATTRKPSPKHP
jgi:hypothetical protein